MTETILKNNLPDEWHTYEAKGISYKEFQCSGIYEMNWSIYAARLLKSNH